MTRNCKPAWKAKDTPGPVMAAGRTFVLLFLVLAAQAADIAKPSWRDVPLVTGGNAADKSGKASILDARQGLFAPFDDLTRLSAVNGSGASGVIAMSDAGVNGPFLAVWWNAEGLLVATTRAMAGVSENTFTLRNGGQTELLLIRRKNMIYAYAKEAARVEPLIAVDFDFGPGLLAGALVEYANQRAIPAVSPVLESRTLTVDAQPLQPDTALAGVWRLENDPEPPGGSHLVNRGDDAKAVASVQLRNLLAGTHELWIRYAADKTRTPVAQVLIEGLADPVALGLNQQISGGVWLAIGSYETASDVTVTVRLKPGVPGSGSLSLDAIHEVWSAWMDDNQDHIPDVLEAANGLTTELKNPGMENSGDRLAAMEDLRQRPALPVTEKKHAAVPGSRKAIFFVHASLGDDAYDGSTDQPQIEASGAVRSGPKKTIEAALKSAARSVTEIELHLDGRVAPPPGGFQNLGNVNIVLVPGKNGASLESFLVPTKLPTLRPPAAPVRP